MSKLWTKSSPIRMTLNWRAWWSMWLWAAASSSCTNSCARGSSPFTASLHFLAQKRRAAQQRPTTVAMYYDRIHTWTETCVEINKRQILVGDDGIYMVLTIIVVSKRTFAKYAGCTWWLIDGWSRLLWAWCYNIRTTTFMHHNHQFVRSQEDRTIASARSVGGSTPVVLIVAAWSDHHHHQSFLVS